MGVGASGQNQALLFALGDSAIRSARADGSVHWSLQHRDPERDAWVEVGRFPSKQVAAMSLDALVANGHGPKSRFRIRKVTIRQHG